MKTSHLFLSTLAMLGLMTSAISMGLADDSAPGGLTRHDKLKIAAQRICPVSGGALGDHGTPLKAKIGEEELYLCCDGCLTGQIDKAHWATIHANFAKAQGECPVMEKALPKNPKWTVVNGQIIYVCCPPCTKKIQADPRKYLTKLDTLYEAAQRKDRAASQGARQLR